jgi:hypothetical protein
MLDLCVAESLPIGAASSHRTEKNVGLSTAKESTADDAGGARWMLWEYFQLLRCSWKFIAFFTFMSSQLIWPVEIRGVCLLLLFLLRSSSDVLLRCTAVMRHWPCTSVLGARMPFHVMSRTERWDLIALWKGEPACHSKKSQSYDWVRTWALSIHNLHVTDWARRALRDVCDKQQMMIMVCNWTSWVIINIIGQIVKNNNICNLALSIGILPGFKGS